jgi:hypothetical protein
MSKTTSSSQGQKRRTVKLVVLWGAVGLAVIFFCLIAVQVVRHGIYRMDCSTNMKSLAAALVVYGGSISEEGEFPPANKWCDLLLESRVLTKDSLHIFACRGAENGPCNYALNPTCDANSPGDVVLLFETKGGWNQYGGPEILTTENHGGKGCNVVSKNGSVRFVKTEELGQLKWDSGEAKE